MLERTRGMPGQARMSIISGAMPHDGAQKTLTAQDLANIISSTQTTQSFMGGDDLGIRPPRRDAPGVARAL
jgi:hypothetical protein